MRIYVIRHGQSEANLKNAHAGWSQVPLTEKGIAQAQAVQPRLRELHFDKVIVSDLLRARQTAENALPGYDYTYDWRIREIGVGQLEGELVSDCEAKLGESYIRNRQNRDFTAYGGENLKMMQARIAAFMDDLTREPEDAQIAVVCHEGAIFCMVCHVLQCQPTRLAGLADNCSVSVFTYKSGQWILNKWNETGNLIPEAK